MKRKNSKANLQAQMAVGAGCRLPIRVYSRSFAVPDSPNIYLDCPLAAFKDGWDRIMLAFWVVDQILRAKRG
jgi:hypothetical protein